MPRGGPEMPRDRLVMLWGRLVMPRVGPEMLRGDLEYASPNPVRPWEGLSAPPPRL